MDKYQITWQKKKSQKRINKEMEKRRKLNKKREKAIKQREKRRRKTKERREQQERQREKEAKVLRDRKNAKSGIHSDSLSSSLARSILFYFRYFLTFFTVFACCL